MLDTEVMRPRNKDKAAMASPGAKFVYLYAEELFSVRRKEFFPLSKAAHLLGPFKDNLSHESDGLILQVSPECSAGRLEGQAVLCVR